MSTSTALGPDEVATIVAVGNALTLEPLVEDMASFARETFVCPLRDRASGIRVDLIFSNTPYEHAAIARASVMSTSWVRRGAPCSSTGLAAYVHEGNVAAAKLPSEAGGFGGFHLADQSVARTLWCPCWAW